MALEYSADRFFNLLLPAILENHPEAARLNGIIQFLIMGRPDRAYALNLIEIPPRVEIGENEAADLWIAIDQELVIPMIVGELNVAAAIEDDRLQVTGEVALLSELSQLLASQSLLTLRSSEMGRGRE